MEDGRYIDARADFARRQRQALLGETNKPKLGQVIHMPIFSDLVPMGDPVPADEPEAVDEPMPDVSEAAVANRFERGVGEIVDALNATGHVTAAEELRDKCITALSKGATVNDVRDFAKKRLWAIDEKLYIEITNDFNYSDDEL